MRILLFLLYFQLRVIGNIQSREFSCLYSFVVVLYHSFICLKCAVSFSLFYHGQNYGWKHILNRYFKCFHLISALYDFYDLFVLSVIITIFSIGYDDNSTTCQMLSNL